MILLPDAEGSFPVIVCRSPYVKNTVNMPEDEVLESCYNGMKKWLDRGYAVVNAHCRGQGKSTGAFIPYIHEREDGLALLDWIREQNFYNGELFLIGGSYTASLHYTTAPFADDVKGAVFEVQDSERYRLWYRNGQMRKGHANWHFGLYKDKCALYKKVSMRSFSELPLIGLSERVLGEKAEDFEEMLEAESPSHPFWSTRNGGGEARDAVTDANIPILLTTGYNDFYVGGVFDMWRKMSPRTKEKSALLVSPYNHGDGYDATLGVAFPVGRRTEQFGASYQIDWFDNIRKGTPISFKKGVVTYYRAFENTWKSDFYAEETRDMELSLGKGKRTFKYDPQDPPTFRTEGLMAEDFGERADVLTVFTEPFSADTLVKGQMRVKLAVSSSAPDTSFYVRISIKKEEYTYVLRHDITSLCYQLGDYEPEREVMLNFRFDEYAFLIKEGESLRLDISSTDNGGYVCHTNRRGEYYLQTGSDVAVNTVYLDRSSIILPT